MLISFRFHQQVVFHYFSVLRSLDCDRLATYHVPFFTTGVAGTCSGRGSSESKTRWQTRGRSPKGILKDTPNSQSLSFSYFFTVLLLTLFVCNYLDLFMLFIAKSIFDLFCICFVLNGFGFGFIFCWQFLIIHERSAQVKRSSGWLCS